MISKRAVILALVAALVATQSEFLLWDGGRGESSSSRPARALAEEGLGRGAGGGWRERRVCVGGGGGGGERAVLNTLSCLSFLSTPSHSRVRARPGPQPRRRRRGELTSFLGGGVRRGICRPPAPAPGGGAGPLSTHDAPPPHTHDTSRRPSLFPRARARPHVARPAGERGGAQAERERESGDAHSPPPSPPPPPLHTPSVPPSYFLSLAPSRARAHSRSLCLSYAGRLGWWWRWWWRGLEPRRRRRRRRRRRGQPLERGRRRWRVEWRPEGESCARFFLGARGRAEGGHARAARPPSSPALFHPSFFLMSFLPSFLSSFVCVGARLSLRA